MLAPTGTGEGRRLARRQDLGRRGRFCRRGPARTTRYPASARGRGPGPAEDRRQRWLPCPRPHTQQSAPRNSALIQEAFTDELTRDGHWIRRCRKHSNLARRLHGCRAIGGDVSGVEFGMVRPPDCLEVLISRGETSALYRCLDSFMPPLGIASISSPLVVGRKVPAVRSWSTRRCAVLAKGIAHDGHLPPSRSSAVKMAAASARSPSSSRWRRNPSR
jgi:hypothetical protein